MSNKKDYVILKIDTIQDSWNLEIKRTYAERLMKQFNLKFFKSGTMEIGNFNCGQKIQVFNIKYIVSMAIKEETKLEVRDPKHKSNKNKLSCEVRV